MLVLTRRPGEAFVIGEGIRVIVLAVEGERVKLGIEAPREVPVVRSELLAVVEAANRQAAGARTQVLERLKRVFTSTSRSERLPT
ncbi:carbon storage regulator [Thermomicrobium sp.]